MKFSKTIFYSDATRIQWTCPSCAAQILMVCWVQLAGIVANISQSHLVHLMEGLPPFSRILSVQLPTKLVFFFHLCKREKSTSVLTSTMIWMTLHYGHKPGLSNTLTLVPSWRSLTNPLDPLSIMWWDPTPDKFESFGTTIVDGLGELLKSKISSLEAVKRDLESRIEDYKQACRDPCPPNTYLLSIVKAMQDAFVRLSLLKTIFTEMRFGLTEFQHYFLKVHSCLDYLMLYKPQMDGQKPAAHCCELHQSFHQHSLYSARLPFHRFTCLVPSTSQSLGDSPHMQYIRDRSPCQSCRHSVCFRTWSTFPIDILQLYNQLPETCLHSCLFTNVAGLQRPLCESIERLVDSILAQHIFLPPWKPRNPWLFNPLNTTKVLFLKIHSPQRP